MVTAAAALTGSAEASSFTVNPVQIHLSSKVPSALLTLRNDSDQPLRFQLAAFRWDQTADDPIALHETEDVIFFPALVIVSPGEERKIRVAVAAGSSVVEKTYRLFVEELAPVEKPDEASAGVKVLTKMGIPIFVQPSRAVGQATLDGVAVAGRTVSFAIRNGGNTHFIVEQIIVRLNDAAGELLGERRLSGWYVLGGREHVYRVDVPDVDCSKVTKAAVEVRIGKSVLTEQSGARAVACTP